MAKPDSTSQSQLEKPIGTPASKKDDVKIHVIPEQFYGVALKKKIIKKEPEGKPLKKTEDSSSEQVPPTQLPPNGENPLGSPKKKGKGTVLVIVFAVLILFGGGAGVFFLLRTAPESPEPIGPVCGNSQCERPQETSVTCPSDCGQPAPVCGNGTCEKPTETPFTCEEDCGPPPAVCGDNKCDATESFETCSADCEPPAPVCGNTTCEEGEDFLSCVDDCEPPEPVSGVDTDSDGLSDREEQTIYNSDPNLSNTDGDSFVDLNEVLNLFDPATPAPSRLIDNPGVIMHMEQDEGYEIYRPSSWSSSDNPERGRIFTAPDGAVVRVVSRALPEGVSFVEWYTGFNSGDSFEQKIVQQHTKKGYEVVFTNDRFAAYLYDEARGKGAFIGYVLPKEREVYYRVTFEMMVNSFQFTE